MLKGISRTQFVELWFGAVAVIIASIIAMGVNVGVAAVASLLTMSLVPPAIMWLVWRGAPSPTVGELLYP